MKDYPENGQKQDCLCCSLDTVLSENRFQLPSCWGEQLHISALHSGFNCRALRVRFQLEVRSKSHLRLKSCPNEINCIVIRKPAHIKGMGEEGVPRRIYQRKLINHRKWNEHTRGFSTSDQWSNLKGFMGEGGCVYECVHVQLCGYTLVKKRCFERFICQRSWDWGLVVK